MKDTVFRTNICIYLTDAKKHAKTAAQIKENTYHQGTELLQVWSCPTFQESELDAFQSNLHATIRLRNLTNVTDRL